MVFAIDFKWINKRAKQDEEKWKKHNTHERNTKNVISENVSSGADTHVERISHRTQPNKTEKKTRDREREVNIYKDLKSARVHKQHQHKVSCE